ncbi:MAG: hypothetical protein MSC30_03775 [Gaiellaceae bacterium MAG52_C11]|nr:hypothetical protein [Candidatus Gaiellasilicea maunaloa]
MANIQIRNVPPELHRTLKQRAEKAGVSLQEYLLGEVTTIAKTPTMDEVIARVRSRELYDLEPASAETIAQIRREDDEQLESR